MKKMHVTYYSILLFSYCAHAQYEALPLEMKKVNVGKNLTAFPKAFIILNEISKDITIEKNNSPCWYNNEIISNILLLISKYPNSRSALTAQLLLLEIYSEEVQSSEFYVDTRLKNIYLDQIKSISGQIQENHGEKWESYFASNSKLLLLSIAGKEAEIQELLRNDLNQKAIRYYNELNNSMQKDPYYLCYLASIDKKFRKNIATLRLEAIMDASRASGDSAVFNKANKILNDEILSNDKKLEK